MNTKIVLLSSLTVVLTLTSALGQQSAGQAPPAPQAPPAAGQANPANPPGSLPPGLENREQLPPGLRNRDLPPGLQRQLGSATNFPRVNTNAFGTATNQFGVTNQFGLTNRFGTNQFGAATNRFGITNRFGVTPPGLTNRLLPTGSVSNRVFGTNIPGVGVSNTFGTNAFGQGVTAADRALLSQIQQVLQPVLSSSGTAMPVRALTREGVVTLVGVVPSPQQSQQIEAAVAQVPGVVRVSNRLVVNPNPNQNVQPGAVLGTNRPPGF